MGTQFINVVIISGISGIAAMLTGMITKNTQLAMVGLALSGVFVIGVYMIVNVVR